MAERRAFNPRVGGSIPLVGTILKNQYSLGKPGGRLNNVIATKNNICPGSSVGRVLRLHRGGHRFESCPGPFKLKGFKICDYNF